jgi:predicted MFS family arabinose efflux permease
VALAPGVWFAAPALFCFGGAIGAMDVAMNSNAVAVERHLGRAVMSSSHGFWSLGGFAGGGLGGTLIQAYGYLPHALFATSACWRQSAWRCAWCLCRCPTTIRRLARLRNSAVLNCRVIRRSI